MKIDIKASESGAQLATRLRKIARLPGLNDVLRQQANDIVSRARTNLSDGRPPETNSGRLANSLTIIKDPDGYQVATTLDYGFHLEFGTMTRRAMPWLGPAIDQSARDFGPQIRAYLTARLARS